MQSKFLEALPKLTISNARIEYPALKDLLRTQASRVLRQHHHIAENGVALRYLLDYGVLHNDVDYQIFSDAQAAALPIIVGRNAPYRVAFVNRPYPAAQPPLAAQASAVEIQLHKEQLVFIQDFYDILTIFEEALLNHVDEYIFEQLKVNGSHVDVRLHTMINFLDTNYSILTITDLQYLHNQYRINFSSTVSLSAQIAQMTKHFTTIELRAPTEAVRPSDKISALIQNIQSMDPKHIEQLSSHILRYKQDYPAILTQTFEALSAYLITRFINDATETTSSIGLTHSISKTTLYNKSEVEDMIKLAVELALKSNSNKAKNNKKDATQQQKQQFTRDTSAFYCFYHGYQKSHKGSECKILLQYKEFCGQAMAATQPTKFHSLISTEIGLNDEQKSIFKDLVKAHKST